MARPWTEMVLVLGLGKEGRYKWKVIYERERVRARVCVVERVSGEREREEGRKWRREWET